MIDIHCHILPNFDDGSKNMKMTLEMGRQAYENNVTTIVSTSHYSCTAEQTKFVTTRDELIEQVRKEFLGNGIYVEICP